jgi:hypothetical protein
VRLVLPCLIAGILLLVLPDAAFAFGPAAHVYLGTHLLDALTLIPSSIADLLRAYPQSFLYGSMAADISFAKKYVPAGRHCHFWHVGEEILQAAQNDRSRAVGYGYLSHLAADTIAHNFFVPRQLMLTATTKALGHAYWEHNDRWHFVLDRAIQASRWDLSEPTMEAYLSRSFEFIVDYLRRGRESMPAALDPVGDFNLQLAKKVRKLAIKEGALQNPKVLHDMADDFFPLPNPDFGYWQVAKAS